MQFDEKVLTALEVLTDAAENDFELYRICTLVRDLIAPPVVKQVDEKHQYFNSVTYHKDPSAHYGSHEGIHRAVWQYYHGEIPEGFLIHHDDENPENNALSNLVLKDKSSHRRDHVKAAPISAYEPTTCSLCGKIYVAYRNGKKVNYCPECRTKVKYQHRKFARTCKWCGKQFESRTTRAKYCSPICRGKATSARNGKSETKTCPICGKEFTAFKSAHQTYCSTECAGEGRGRDFEATGRYTQSRETRKCPVCGKEFTVPKSSSKVCCSLECGYKYRNQRQYSEAREVRKCPVCGKEFNAVKSEPKIFCSRECGYKGKRKRTKSATQIELDFTQPSTTPAPSKDSSAATL